MSAIGLLAAPPAAGAQSSQGSIAVAATILPAPATVRPVVVTLSAGAGGNALLSIEGSSANAAHTVTAFVRLTRGDGDASDIAFVAQPSDAATMLQLDRSKADVRLRLERLVTAGT